MIQYGRPGRSSWTQSVRSSIGRCVMGKAIWENPIAARLGKGFQLRMLTRTPSKRVNLICVCGWHKTGWKETKSSSDVEITQQRSRFGRTNIFVGSCILGMHSKTMPNKQRYCGQLQNHVWIANFRGENWKTSILWESSYFFMVKRNGGSCKEMCGAILWVSKQDDSTTPQVRSQIVLKCLDLARIGRPDILWSLNKLARSITQWTKACDKRLNRLISYIHHTCEYKQYCYVGNIARQCRLGLVQDSDFAGDLEDSKSTSGGTFCVFGSHTFVPISWMCKKQTSVSHSSTESEFISLDAGLRLDGLSALELWDLIVSVLGNMTQITERPGRPVEIDRSQRSQGETNALNNIDRVPSKVQSSHQEALLYVFEDNEAAIKMIIKGRSPTMRHVSRTHRVALDWLFDRINLDPKIQIKYIDTKDQLADILTKGNFTRDEWNHLLSLFNISHFSSTVCSDTMAKRSQYAWTFWWPEKSLHVKILVRNLMKIIINLQLIICVCVCGVWVSGVCVCGRVGVGVAACACGRGLLGVCGGVEIIIIIVIVILIIIIIIFRIRMWTFKDFFWPWKWYKLKKPNYKLNCNYNLNYNLYNYIIYVLWKDIHWN